MPQILADRFLHAGSRWIDLATGALVRVRVAPAGPTADQLAWSDWCAIVSNLRHPLINPLLDYGTADRTHVFEAYAADVPLPGGGGGARLLDHGLRFLQARGADLRRPLADYLLRPLVRGSSAAGRPIGVSLQPRPALESICEALASAGPAGPCSVDIAGERGSGLRTLRLAAARAARLAGYVPICAAVLRRESGLMPSLAGRHVCLLTDEDDGDAAAAGAVLIRLAAASPRRHVMLSFRRTLPAAPVVPIDRMEPEALLRMVFLDEADRPSDAVLRDALRYAGGRPGAFLARIAGEVPAAGRRTQPMLVHELSPAYGQDPRPASARPPAGGRRIAALLERAPERARTLARVGRHAGAARLLRRALRVLAARGRHDAAARCAVGLGTLLLERGQPGAAAESFMQAGALAPAGETAVRGGIGTGVAWTDEGRLVEAEAALRAASAAADRSGCGPLRDEAAAALARCLLWQGRTDEAAASLAGARAGDRRTPTVRLLLVRARVLMAQQATAEAVRAAREALECARAGDPAAVAGALRVLALAVAAAGDPAAASRYVEDGLRAAAAGHAPLDAVRLRLAALDIEAAAVPSASARRLAARLAAASRRWPPLLRAYARAVRARIDGTPLDPATRTFVDASGAAAIAHAAAAGSPNPVATLETLLDLGQTASDDRTAIERIGEHLRTRLRAATLLVTGPDPERRTLAFCGEPWRGEPIAAWRALASGLSVPLDPRAEPCQAAEPLRFSGEVIGSLAARWVAGTTTDPGRAGALLRIGALALAANARGLLDRVLVPPPGPAGQEILGESPPIRTLRDAIVRAARAPFPVLIEGESGSGKELVARAIHTLGPRRDRRFCAINCAALADDLLEAELFGHARGAFTGAVGERQGLFEEADGGTLFLDEIGELSARAQAKLLRVLQDGQVRRVGENTSRRVDVRIVAATNRRLAEEAAAGRFRADLRFRLDVIRIDVPPLRERSADVPLLASAFWSEASARMGSRATLAPETLAALARYDWPGNVRELQNVIAWMAVHSPGRGRIAPGAVPAHVAQAAVRGGGTLEAARAEFERRFVKAALATAGGRRAGAAAALGVSRQGLAKMLRRLALDDQGR